MPGKCFQSSIQKMIDLITKDKGLADDIKLAHGIVTGQGGAVKGKKYGHAWLEIKDAVVHDCEAGATLIKNDYYKKGNIDPATVKLYDFQDVRYWISKEETYGPWELEMPEDEKELQKEAYDDYDAGGPRRSDDKARDWKKHLIFRYSIKNRDMSLSQIENLIRNKYPKRYKRMLKDKQRFYSGDVILKTETKESQTSESAISQGLNQITEMKTTDYVNEKQFGKHVQELGGSREVGLTMFTALQFFQKKAEQIFYEIQREKGGNSTWNWQKDPKGYTQHPKMVQLRNFIQDKLQQALNDGNVPIEIIHIDHAESMAPLFRLNLNTNEGTRCWKGYKKKGMKTMFGKRVPNCVKNEGEVVDMNPSAKKPLFSPERSQEAYNEYYNGAAVDTDIEIVGNDNQLYVIRQNHDGDSQHFDPGHWYLTDADNEIVDFESYPDPGELLYSHSASDFYPEDPDESKLDEYGVPDYNTMPTYKLKRAKKGKQKFFLPSNEPTPKGVEAISEGDVIKMKDYKKRLLKYKFNSETYSKMIAKWMNTKDKEEQRRLKDELEDYRALGVEQGKLPKGPTVTETSMSMVDVLTSYGADPTDMIGTSINAIDRIAQVPLPRRKIITKHLIQNAQRSVQDFYKKGGTYSHVYLTDKDERELWNSIQRLDISKPFEKTVMVSILKADIGKNYMDHPALGGTLK